MYIYNKCTNIQPCLQKPKQTQKCVFDQDDHISVLGESVRAQLI